MGARASPSALAGLLAFVRARLTGDYEVDEFGFDPELTDKVLLELLRPLYERWFRVETLELKQRARRRRRAHRRQPLRHPARRRADAAGGAARRGRAGALRLLGADLVYQLPVLVTWRARPGTRWPALRTPTGCCARASWSGCSPRASRASASRSPSATSCSGSAVAGSSPRPSEPGCRSCPCAIVGAEEIYPKIGDLPALARLLGLPYLPITPLFPLLGPLGLVPLPSKWLIEFGEPIRTDEYDPAEADDPMLVFNLTDQIREVIQQQLDELRLRRGHAFPPFF